MTTTWAGVFPAITTKFTENQNLDLGLMGQHVQAMIDAGVHGPVVLGSFGENGTLSPAEKGEILTLVCEVTGKRVPVLACVAETTTAGAARFAERAASLGAEGIMLLINDDDPYKHGFQVL